MKVSAPRSSPVVKAYRNMGKLQLPQFVGCPKYMTLHMHLPQIIKKNPTKKHPPFFREIICYLRWLVLLGSCKACSVPDVSKSFLFRSRVVFWSLCWLAPASCPPAPYSCCRLWTLLSFGQALLLMGHVLSNLIIQPQEVSHPPPFAL